MPNLPATIVHQQAPTQARRRFENTAMALAMAACLSCAYKLDDPSDMDAQTAGAESYAESVAQQRAELRRDLAAAKHCREAYGFGAGFLWTAEGVLVCTPPQQTTPRKDRPQGPTLTAPRLV